jgi:hypothetical protein
MGFNQLESEIRYSVKEYADKRVKDIATEDPSGHTVTSASIETFVRTYLSVMQDGEQHLLPVPGTHTVSRTVVLTKVNCDEFTLREESDE